VVDGDTAHPSVRSLAPLFPFAHIMAFLESCLAESCQMAIAEQPRGPNRPLGGLSDPQLLLCHKRVHR
jgi:hypothetical protein